MLENSLRALADGVRDAPRDRWDPEFVVQQVGRRPDSLATWVRDNTAWVPYRGTLRGPVGVLMDRRGNGLDRALLLAELLARAGHTARLAHRELTAAQAEPMLGPALMAGTLAQLREGHEPPADTSVRDIAVSYGLDASAVEATLQAQQGATANLVTELEEQSVDQAARLLDAVAGPPPSEEWATRWDSALVAMRDHWWVQVQDGAAWQDLDPSPRDSTLLTLAPTETVAPDAVAPALHHDVVVRVIAERLHGGSLTETPTLEHTVRPRDVIQQPVALQFWPVAWPSTGLSPEDSGRSFRRAALQQEAWSAALIVGDRVAAHGRLAASEGGREANSGGVGGLGGAITGAVSARSSQPSGADNLLTAVWIEYELRSPGRRARVVRRSVFDLVGPANRRESRFDVVRSPTDSLRLARSLALMMRTQILVLGAHPASEFVMHTFARSATANAELLRAIAMPGSAFDQHRVDSLLKVAVPSVDPLHTFAVLRQEALGHLGFLDQPSVFTRHRFPSALGGGVATNDAFDVVANEVGIALTERDGFAARLAQGVWDTNLEALLGGPGGNAAAAFARMGDWSVLRDAEQIGDRRLTPSARELLRHELDRGALIVAPDATATGADGDAAAWWRIDPVTGDALGIGPRGWGQGVEWSIHLSAMVEISSWFVFAYAQCHAIPQAANALNILGSEFWRLGLTPSWVTRPPDPNLPEFSISNPKAFAKDAEAFMRGQGKNKAGTGAGQLPTPGKDFEEVAAENNRKCVLDAIRSGFLATAPILLMHLRANRAGAQYTRMRAQVRAARLPDRRGQIASRVRAPGARRGPRIANPARGEQGLRRTQDLGKTQPDVKTRPIAAQPTMPGMGRSSKPQGPFPGSVAEAERSYKAAFDEFETANKTNMSQARELVQYRAAVRDGLTPLDADRLDKLTAESAEASERAGEAVAKLREADAMVEWAKKAANRREIPFSDPATASPPPGSPAVGGSPGPSAGSSPPQAAASPMANTSGPAPAPRPVTSLSNALMAVGLAGITGED